MRPLSFFDFNWIEKVSIRICRRKYYDETTKEARNKRDTTDTREREEKTKLISWMGTRFRKLKPINCNTKIETLNHNDLRQQRRRYSAETKMPKSWRIRSVRFSLLPISLSLFGSYIGDSMCLCLLDRLLWKTFLRLFWQNRIIVLCMFWTETKIAQQSNDVIEMNSIR